MDVDSTTSRGATSRVSSSSANISRDEVAHLASLARLALTDDELDRYAGQLDVIITSVARVAQVAADDIPPTSHALPLTNVMRDDEVRPGLTQEQALAGAPAVQQGRFQVPRILEEEA
jgi:aspartyl-tRNA(Asn)/glutamyl-tRNA(Gln) amidotransferase subunit C